jgi:2-desacetyl-2-hydroxyethyl bacteriochlorophyllide A dehydrogenase
LSLEELDSARKIAAVEPLPLDAGPSAVRPTAHVVMFDRSAKVKVWKRSVPVPERDQVVVRMLASLISPGSELRVLHRSFDAPHWVNWGRLPFFPGYSAVGVVEECGPDAALPIGQRIVVRCPHTSWAMVPAAACVPVDDDLPVDAQVWFALARIAATALPLIPSPLGRHIAVVGDGPIGQMVVRWLHCAGAERITVVGRHQLRLDFARQGGATDVRVYDERLHEPRAADGAEFAVDASGTEAGFTVAQALVARGGTVIMLGDPGHPGALRFHPRFVPDSLRLVVAKDNPETDAQNAAGMTRMFQQLVRRGTFRLAGLITDRLDAGQAALAYERCADKAHSIGVMFDWEGSARREMP